MASNTCATHLVDCPENEVIPAPFAPAGDLTEEEGSPMAKNATSPRILRLKPGEKLPDGPPRRRDRTRFGYILLVWPDPDRGAAFEVAVLEHRVDGDHVTTAEHVHHINHVKDDNRPENLQAMTASAHMRLHGGNMPDHHGTSGGYTNHKCRCVDCRAAWATTMREYKRRRVAEGRPLPKYPKKGSL